MIEGNSCSAISRKLGVCTSTINHRKRSLAAKILDFMGENILVEIQRQPNWKDDQTVTKEKRVPRTPQIKYSTLRGLNPPTFPLD
jgi:hypothetical protein